MWIVDVFFLVSLTKLLNKHSNCEWFEIPCCSYNISVIDWPIICSGPGLGQYHGWQWPGPLCCSWNGIESVRWISPRFLWGKYITCLFFKMIENVNMFYVFPNISLEWQGLMMWWDFASFLCTLFTDLTMKYALINVWITQRKNQSHDIVMTTIWICVLT